LRIKDNNKLFERRANSFEALKENVVKQTVKLYIYIYIYIKEACCEKGKELPRSLMTNALSATRLSICWSS